MADGDPGTPTPGLLGNIGSAFSGPNTAALYGGLLSDPATQRALNWRGFDASIGAAADLAMPTRMPIPTGAVLGKMASAWGPGQDAVMAARLQNAQAYNQQLQGKGIQSAIDLSNAISQGLLSPGGTGGIGAPGSATAAPGSYTPAGAGGPVMGAPGPGKYGFGMGDTAATTGILNGQYGSLIQNAANKYNIPANLLASMIQTESSGNPNAVSPKGATGLMQLMPPTASDMGVANPTDPAQNIEGGAKYLRKLLDQNGGDYPTALRAYSGGDSAYAGKIFAGIPRSDFSSTHGSASAYLVNTINQVAPQVLPQGYSIQIKSTDRPGATVAGTGGVSQHALGDAVDFQIIRPDGTPIPNTGFDATGLYGRVALGVRGALPIDLQHNLGWGGNFPTGSGARDLMHLDFGGDRGRYGSLAALAAKNYQPGGPSIAQAGAAAKNMPPGAGQPPGVGPGGPVQGLLPQVPNATAQMNAPVAGLPAGGGPAAPPIPAAPPAPPAPSATMGAAGPPGGGIMPVAAGGVPPAMARMGGRFGAMGPQVPAGPAPGVMPAAAGGGPNLVPGGALANASPGPAGPPAPLVTPPGPAPAAPPITAPPGPPAAGPTPGAGAAPMPPTQIPQMPSTQMPQVPPLPVGQAPPGSSPMGLAPGPLNDQMVRNIQALSVLNSALGRNTPQWMQDVARLPYEAQITATQEAAKQPFALQRSAYEAALKQSTEMLGKQYQAQIDLATKQQLSYLQSQGELPAKMTLEEAKQNLVFRNEMAKLGVTFDSGGNAVPIPGFVPTQATLEQAKAAATAAGQLQSEPQKLRFAAQQKDYDENVNAPAAGADKALRTVTAIQNQLPNFRTGEFAPQRLQLAKSWADLLSSIGVQPSGDTQRMIAAGEMINKQGNTLGFEMARELGSREAQIIVQQAIQSNPGLQLTPAGNQQLINLVKLGLNRDVAKKDFYDNWFNSNGNYNGAQQAFLKQNPYETAISKVVPYSVSGTNDPQYKALPSGTYYWLPGQNRSTDRPYVKQ